jgi:hypothetical protein
VLFAVDVDIVAALAVFQRLVILVMSVRVENLEGLTEVLIIQLPQLSQQFALILLVLLLTVCPVKKCGLR